MATFLDIPALARAARAKAIAQRAQIHECSTDIPTVVGEDMGFQVIAAVDTYGFLKGSAVEPEDHRTFDYRYLYRF